MGTELTTVTNGKGNEKKKTDQGSLVASKKLIDSYKDINEDDRKVLFGFSTEADLRSFMFKEEVTCDEIMEVINWFKNEYMIPFWIGDVIMNETNGSRWIVTCVYTDGSIDLISAEGKVERKNIGTLRNDYISDGQLEKIIEPEVNFADLLR